MSHLCHAAGCSHGIPAKMLFCGRHWRMVPPHVQAAVWREYHDGQEVTKTPSVRYLAVQQFAVAHVAMAEQRHRDAREAIATSTKYAAIAVERGDGDPLRGISEAMRARTSTGSTTPDTNASEAPATDTPKAAAETTTVPGAAAPRRRTRAATATPHPDEAQVPPATTPEEPAESLGEPAVATPATPPAERDALLDEAPAPSARDLRMGSGFDAVMDTIFDFDAAEVYPRLKKALKMEVKASRAEYGIILNACDEASECSREAIQAAANAAVARAAFEAEADVLEAAMREEALKSIAAERTTKPTISDIDARMTSMFHDEVRELRERRAKVKATVDYMDNVARVLSERQRDLRQMLHGASKN